jgi:hypothetical protein
VAAIGNQYEFSERLIRLIYMSDQKRQRDAPRRTKERWHRRRPLDVEVGLEGHAANGQYPLESRSSADLNKGGDELMDMDDDNMELFLQVQNTVNYFSTDQTAKGSPFHHRNILRHMWNMLMQTTSPMYRRPLAAQATEGEPRIPDEKHDATETLAVANFVQRS